MFTINYRIVTWLSHDTNSYCLKIEKIIRQSITSNLFWYFEIVLFTSDVSYATDFDNWKNIIT